MRWEVSGGEVEPAERARGTDALLHALLDALDDTDPASLSLGALDEAAAARLAERVLGHPPDQVLQRQLRQDDGDPIAIVRTIAHALTATSVSPRDRTEADLVVRLAFAGQGSEAIAAARRLLQRPHPAAIDDRVRPALVHALFSQGRWDAILTAVAEALEVAGLSDTVRGRLLAERALARIWTGDAAGAKEDAEEALAIGLAGDDALATSLGLGHLSVLSAHAGRLDEAVELAGRGLDEARGDLEAMHRHPHMPLGMALLGAGRLKEAQAALQEGRALGEEHGTAWDLPLYDAMIALVCTTAGDWDRAIAEAEAGLRLSEELGLGVGRVVSLGVVASIAVRRGQLEVARSSIAEADEMIVASGPQWGQWWLELARAALHVAEGDELPALRILSQLWQDGSVEGRLAISARTAGLAARVGAIDVVDEVADWITAAAAGSGVGYAVAGALLCRAVRDGDAEMAEQAATTYRDHGHRPDEAVALEEAAHLRMEAGAVDEAIDLLGRGLEVSEALDARWDAARLAASLRGLGVRIGPRSAHRRADTGWDALTPSELEVVRLTATGLTNPQVGERLFISRRTVQSHLSHVYRKLGITSRVQLAALVSERGAFGDDERHGARQVADVSRTSP